MTMVQSNPNDPEAIYSLIGFDAIRSRLSQLAQSEQAKERLRTLTPVTNPEVVRYLLAETTEAVHLLGSGGHLPFLGLTQIQHLMDKIEKGIVLSAEELTIVVDFLRGCRLGRQFFERNAGLTPILYQYSLNLGNFSSTEAAIYQAIRGNQLVDEASRTLKKIRQRRQEKQEKMDERLQKALQEASQKKYLQEAMIVERNGRQTLPIQATYKNKFKGTVVDTSSKGLTVYMEPVSIQRLTADVWQLKMEEEAESYQILAELTGYVAADTLAIRQSLEVVVTLEVIMARAKLAREMSAREPEINEAEKIQLVGVKHPFIDDPVPLSLMLGEDFRGLTITGPNAGGKTVVLKTVALMQVMAQSGLQIPCEAGTSLPTFDQVFVSIGDAQNLANSLSTFSAHLSDLASFVRKARRHTLILVDEIGSGTDPKEGAALANALLEYFYQSGSLVLSTTHYGEIKDFSKAHPAFETAAMVFDSETLAPSYQLVMGESGESNAFGIAEHVQLAPSIQARAHDFMSGTVNLEDPTIYEVKTFEASKAKTTTYQTARAWQQGDRVILTEWGNVGLVYEDVPMSNDVVIYHNGQMERVPEKRVKLSIPASELYPRGYDKTRLFMTYEDYKAEHDLMRGSKKSQKQLQKKQRKR
ncbi:MAG: endonuclease MutS2 [Aerococcus sp.]|nr:endonuclease MutS2 [Aerococcus sp.]